MNLTLTKPINDIIKDRTKYLGGSDAAAVLGKSRWKTPLQLWAEKTGQIIPEDISEKIYIKVGNGLEDLVAKLFCEETGKTAHRVNSTFFHPDFDFIGATIDRRIVGEDAILECKTASVYKAKEWEEDIPQEYILQCLHYLAVTGTSTCYLAVLIGNQDFKIKTITKKENQEIIDILIKKEIDFWFNFVLPKVMPGTILRQDGKTLEELFSNTTEEEIELTDEANQIIEQIESLEEDLRSQEAIIDMKKNLLKSMMKENTLAKTNLYQISWKPQITKRIDSKKLKEEKLELYNQYTKEISSRVLRIKKIGEKDNE